jgi:hypothetical protein
LRIESYFQRIREIFDACPFVQSSELTFDQRSSHEGFIRGTMYFRDGSLLHLREFIDVETSVERLTYVFQYMDRTGKLVFRYDNTRHHRDRNLPTYPHHKHEGEEGGIVASSPQDLASILKQVESLVLLP